MQLDRYEQYFIYYDYNIYVMLRKTYNWDKPTNSQWVSQKYT